MAGIHLGALGVTFAAALNGAQPVPVGALPGQTLLVLTVLLAGSLVALSLFTLWQSHRTHMETVRLHQRITETHEAFLARVVRMMQDGRRPRPAPTSSALPASAGKGDSRARTRATRAAPRTPPAARVAPDSAPATLRSVPPELNDLSDVEYAVLEKLASDPAFFIHHPLYVFGADQRTLDSLVERGFVKLDGLGRPTVQPHVQNALKTWLPRN